MRSRTLGNTFVYAWRSLRNHWLWGDKPFRRGQAWLDMIMRASYTNHQFLIDDKPIEQKRGEFLTSIRDLATTWGWSRTKAERFLKVLKIDQMIEYKKFQKKYTTISIVNYDLYQSYEIESTPEKPDKGQPKEPDKSNRKSTEEPQKSLINKEYKGNKEDNIPIPQIKFDSNKRIIEEFTKAYRTNIKKNISVERVDEMMGGIVVKHGEDKEFLRKYYAELFKPNQNRYKMPYDIEKELLNAPCSKCKGTGIIHGVAGGEYKCPDCKVDK